MILPSTFGRSLNPCAGLGSICSQITQGGETVRGIHLVSVHKRNPARPKLGGLYERGR